MLTATTVSNRFLPNTDRNLVASCVLLAPFGDSDHMKRSFPRVRFDLKSPPVRSQGQRHMNSDGQLQGDSLMLRKNFSIPDLSGWSHFIQASLLVALMLTAWTTTATSHGAVENPASRTTVCRFDADARSNPMCDQAWATEPQALWDWMEVNLGAVAGAHREQIPDGTLCGAGRDKYRAFNIPGEWPATVMQPEEDGLYPVTFHATAPHEARYFRFYLTREGFDPTRDRLQWSDLELVYDSGRLYVQELIANPHYTFRMPLPERQGRAILYLVWQRIDSPEAFYGCSDVILGESTDPQTQPPVTPPVVTPPTEVEPIETNPSIPAPGMDALSVAVDLYDDWGSGACGEGVVTNNGSTNSVWEVNVDLVGSVTNYWNSEMRYSTHPHCEGSEIPYSWRVVGAPWNRTLEPGASTTFGFCIDRTQEPEVPPADAPTVPIVEPPPVVENEFIDLATFGLSHGSDHTGHDGLVGGRTAITTEALLAYNDLREFVGLAPATLDEVGEWAFANTLTNNTQAWGNDQQGVGLWYSMQGAKVGWMADDMFDPQIVADIERTARLGAAEDVMAVVAEYGHEGFAEYLAENGFAEAFINTLKMEPHYAGWMHDRAHGWLSIEAVAIAHDVNHLTVLSHDQMQPFMNDTWDWPQWPALDVSHARVLEYFQSMVVLGDPLGDHLSDLSAPPVQDDPSVPEAPPANQPDAPGVVEEPGLPAPEASSISVEVGGQLWWNGFTAQLIVRNGTGADLDSWSLRFISSHRITGNPWGAALETVDVGNGFYEYRLSGIDWNQSIPEGGSVTFGFNASQGEAIGNSGLLDADQLFDGGFLGD